MNLINAKYGSEPGLKTYTHVSDQIGTFATQNIPAIVSEAPYILDGLLMNGEALFAIGSRTMVERAEDHRAVCRHPLPGRRLLRNHREGAASQITSLP